MQNSAKVHKQLEMLKKEVAHLQETNANLTEVNGGLKQKQNDYDDIFKQLQDANEALRKFRARQEEIDKVLRYQQAKAHGVLKKSIEMTKKSTAASKPRPALGVKENMPM